MSRYQGPASHAEGMLETKRSSPIKKDQGKEKQPPAKPPPPAEEGPEVRPAIVCVQDKRASIQ